jgi:hypothetical protein
MLRAIPCWNQDLQVVLIKKERTFLQNQLLRVFIPLGYMANSKLTDEKFNASFGDEPIEKILNYFEITYGVEFTMEENNEIIIN